MNAVLEAEKLPVGHDNEAIGAITLALIYPGHDLELLLVNW